MQINFSKMHGLGNDFMVIDNVTQNVYLSPELIRKMSDRHFGVGFDQLLVVEPPYDPELDFHYRIFNADGNEVQQCGNGARCFARFVQLKGLISRQKIGVSTANGNIVLHVETNGMVTVNMGKPQFAPDKIPMQAQREELTYLLRSGQETFLCSAVSMGNPHCVIEVPSVADAEVERIGKLLVHHERFPEGANIGFMEIVNSGFIRLRVFERGVGETLACGTGACAAMAVGCQQQKLASRVKVALPGGELSLRWEGANKPVYMIGPAEHVYDGQLTI